MALKCEPSDFCLTVGNQEIINVVDDDGDDADMIGALNANAASTCESNATDSNCDKFKQEHQRDDDIMIKQETNVSINSLNDVGGRCRKNKTEIYDAKQAADKKIAKEIRNNNEDIKCQDTGLRL